MPDLIIIRHSEPNSFDHLPYGTLCKVIVDGKTWTVFKQMSLDENNPRWEPVDENQQSDSK